MELYQHQKDALDATMTYNHVAYYHDMGLGKTFTGSEKLMQLGGSVNLVVCQKSKVGDWIDHFRKYYSIAVFDLTIKSMLDVFVTAGNNRVGVINYDLIFRRLQLLEMPLSTLMLDESSVIQNETSKRSKAILKLKAENVILLSGTPTGGKYERLWSQAKLLGWNISKELFYKQYVEFTWVEEDGFWRQEITGYKNTERMIRKFKEHGAHFLKTDEVMNLPTQTFIPIRIPTIKEYRIFQKNHVVEVSDHELIGDTPLTGLLYSRQLCGQYCKSKLEAFRDLVESTTDRLIVFYNFTEESQNLVNILQSMGRSISYINGSEKNLDAYNNNSDAVTLVQYQAGAMGLNLQLANKIVYYSPPLSSELYEQSKKRIHRIGQDRPCFYYNLICRSSVEERIYSTLEMRRNYTDRLFEKDNKNIT